MTGNPPDGSLPCMPLVTIQPGMPGADFIALTDDVKTWLLANHIKFVCRYFVDPTSTRLGKDIKAWELDWYAEHGIAVVPNFEHEARIDDDGRAGGIKDGQEFARICDEFGVPEGQPGVVSVDQDITQSNLLGAEKYVDGFVEGTGHRPFGIYGDDDIARRFTVNNKLYWRAAATGWSTGRQPTTHVQQHLNLQYHDKTAPNLDPNTCLTAFTAWLPGDDGDDNPAPPEVPTVNEYTIRDSRYANVFHVIDNQVAPLAPELFAALQTRNVPHFEVRHDPTATWLFESCGFTLGLVHQGGEWVPDPNVVRA